MELYIDMGNFKCVHIVKPNSGKVHVIEFFAWKKYSNYLKTLVLKYEDLEIPFTRDESCQIEVRYPFFYLVYLCSQA